MKINFMYVVIVIIFLGVVFIGYLSYSTLFLKSCKGEKCDDNVLSENISEGSGSEDVIWLFAEPWPIIHFEVEDTPSFRISSPVIIKTKIFETNFPRIVVELIKPDGSQLVQEIALVGQCDDFSATTEAPPTCISSSFKSTEVGFCVRERNYWLKCERFDQEGTYILKGKSEDGKIRLRDFSFDVAPTPINELFIQSAAYSYLSSKRKVGDVSYPRYKAIYYTDEYSADILDSGKEIIVEISITQSEETAKNELGAHSTAFKEKGVRNTEFGQPIIALLESKVVGWPSEEKTILITWYNRPFGDEEKNFVREYLEKYPSSLV